jgi:predicted site-specific integrase-resolvase
MNMYSLKTAAAETGTHPMTLRKYIQSGKINATKISRDWVLTEDEVKRIPALRASGVAARGNRSKKSNLARRVNTLIKKLEAIKTELQRVH